MMARSTEIIKLDELNEVSYDIGAFANKILPQPIYHESIGVFHYLIMYNQYAKVFFTEKYRTLPMEFKKIERQHWFRKSAISTICCRKKLQELYGKEYAERIVNFSIFCLHRSWYLYTLGRRLIVRKKQKLHE